MDGKRGVSRLCHNIRPVLLKREHMHVRKTIGTQHMHVTMSQGLNPQLSLCLTTVLSSAARTCAVTVAMARARRAHLEIPIEQRGWIDKMRSVVAVAAVEKRQQQYLPQTAMMVATRTGCASHLALTQFILLYSAFIALPLAHTMPIT